MAAMAVFLPVTALLAVVLLLLPSASLALTEDFCVADLLQADTPSGYPCKPQWTVTAADFSFAGLAGPGRMVPPFNVSLGTAFAKQWPALNGMRLSATRVDFGDGGVVPLHTHPRASEVIYVLSGSLVAGFVSADGNTVYRKTVSQGQMFLFPLGQLHFQYNTGPAAAAALAFYSSSNPGLQLVDWALFANNFPTPDVTKVTYINQAEVKSLKALFGGSG